MTPLHIRIVIAGAVIGFLETVGILFDPEEPYPGFIVAAGMLLVNQWLSIRTQA